MNRVSLIPLTLGINTIFSTVYHQLISIYLIISLSNPGLSGTLLSLGNNPNSPVNHLDGKTPIRKSYLF